MINKQITIPCEIKGRYVQCLVYKISQIPENCYIRFDGRQVNAKSILGILSLGLKQGDVVEFWSNTDKDYNIDEIFANDCND